MRDPYEKHCGSKEEERQFSGRTSIIGLDSSQGGWRWGFKANPSKGQVKTTWGVWDP